MSVKSYWPELVGEPWRAARDVIERERPDISVYPLRVGSITTMDYDLTRVWLFYDPETELVHYTPKAG